MSENINVIPDHMIYFSIKNQIEKEMKEKKTFIINFLNRIVEKPIVTIYNFKYINQNEIIDDNECYNLLCMYFEYINLLFNLNLVYDDTKFNKIGLIELLRLMLKSINLKLIKKEFDDGIKYSII